MRRGGGITIGCPSWWARSIENNTSDDSLSLCQAVTAARRSCNSSRSLFRYQEGGDCRASPSFVIHRCRFIRAVVVSAARSIVRFGLVWFGLVILLGFSRVLRSYVRSGRLWQTADATQTLIRAASLHPFNKTSCPRNLPFSINHYLHMLWLAI
jgi:hypothetical protein